MWRHNAGAINYSVLPSGYLSVIVSVQKYNGIKHIVGTDRPAEDDSWQWEWHGVQPLTFYVRSLGSFVARDPRAKWAVTLFEKTMFSAAGIDIYSRTPSIDGGDLAAAMQVIGQ